MKAIRVHQFGDPSVLKLEEIPEPVPGPGQIVVRVHAAGVNPADTYMRAGKYGPKSFPYTPGNDAGGTIHALGSGVSHLRAGDRVYVAGSISGTYAELTLADQAKVHPLPEHVTFAQGAAIGVPYGTAYRALFQRALAKPAEVVFVHGATGGVGLAAVQLAHAAGMRIIATGGSAQGRDLVTRQGADFVVDHHASDYTQRIMDFTDNAGVDVILEMLANVNLGKDLPMLKRNGRVIIVGSRGKVEIDARDTMAREADIRGMFLGGADDFQYASIHAAIRAGLDLRTLNPIIAQEIPLAEAPKAHEAVMEPSHLGKIVLTV